MAKSLQLLGIFSIPIGVIIKYPKLMELHKHLFNTIPDGLHNSMVDVLVCLRCYGKIKHNVDFNELSINLRSLNVLYGDIFL